MLTAGPSRYCPLGFPAGYSHLVFILTRLYLYTLCPPTQRGAYPSPLNYHGFPKSCCTSVNEVICHGIPDDRKLEDGDIINLDITVYLDGFHGDCSEMFVAGELDDAGKDLVQATYDSWISACQFVESGKDYKDIGAIIEDHVTPRGYSSVRNFCGHGIGRVGECIRPRQLIPERAGDTLIIIFLRDSFPTVSILRRPFTPIPTFYTIATRNPTDKWPSVTPLRLNPYVKSHGPTPTNSLTCLARRHPVSHAHFACPAPFLFVTQMICEGSAKALTWPDEWTATTVRRFACLLVRLRNVGRPS
jgi:hypothetical protein